MSPQNMGNQVDQDPRDLTFFRNAPQGGPSVKPAQLPSVERKEFNVPTDIKATGIFQE